MAGEWEGSGWMMRADGRPTFQLTEDIRFKLDSTTILTEGQGKVEGKIVHDALAIISYNKSSGEFSFRSYLPNGNSGDFNAELLDNRLHWYPNEGVRYIIWINDQGQWQETGEYMREGKWMQFFEMILDKRPQPPELLVFQ